jgi:hypothetical protein
VELPSRGVIAVLMHTGPDYGAMLFLLMLLIGLLIISKVILGGFFLD